MEKNESKKNLLEAVAELHPDSSKTTLRSWIKEGRIYVNGQAVKKHNYILSAGDEVSLGKKKIRKEKGVNVLFEDDHVIVANKPSGLLSVAEDVEDKISLHRMLKERVRPSRLFVVHRLDAGTSGVMVFAKSREALAALKEQWAVHSIDREYRALVEGNVEAEEGTLVSYLAEDKSHFVREVKDESKGRKAVLHYKVMKRGEGYTLLSVTLETGRKNQIRVQMSGIGHPIAGDMKYGGTTDPFGRLCLHAELLGFIHPATGKKVVFTAPMPGKFKGILN